uniref:Macaca fascicularis brain cDNA clone: QflA-21509, similar to human membrane-spanning 4-domains, subfamily A, member 10(MS4A10), mRNA, RefSeq: NM_206893.1 n=1 Tax=Macaca fascicularis TaxID=9541 RepID=I7GD69_MACFA|nr:unnamed protein product [Macaca fascicularis]
MISCYSFSPLGFYKIISFSDHFLYCLLRQKKKKKSEVNHGLLLSGLSIWQNAVSCVLT